MKSSILTSISKNIFFITPTRLLRLKKKGRRQFFKGFLTNLHHLLIIGIVVSGCKQSPVQQQAMKQDTGINVSPSVNTANSTTVPSAAQLPISDSAGMAAAKEQAVKQKNFYSNANLTYKIIPSIENTFGYDIYLDDRITIHQPSIPALPGNKGFETEEQAKKVAELVIKKIRNGEMPPTISTDELKERGVYAK